MTGGSFREIVDQAVNKHKLDLKMEKRLSIRGQEVLKERRDSHQEKKQQRSERRISLIGDLANPKTKVMCEMLWEDGGDYTYDTSYMWAALNSGKFGTLYDTAKKRTPEIIQAEADYQKIKLNSDAPKKMPKKRKPFGTQFGASTEKRLGLDSGGATGSELTLTKTTDLIGDTTELIGITDPEPKPTDSSKNVM